MTEQTWPKDNYSHGTNEWEHDIGAFAKLLQETEGGWWANDFALKYLEIRIDTRDGGFILRDRDGNRISPDRVKTAIDKWNNM